MGRGIPVVQVAQLGAEHHVLRGARGVQVHHVGDQIAPVHRPQHRHDRGDAAARGEEQHPLRRRVGQHETALRRGQAHHGADRDAADQVAGQEALRHRLDRDRDDPLTARTRIRPVRRAGQGVRAPVPATVDEHADTDVLTGFVFEVEAPARLDHQGGRVGGFLAHVHDSAAQLARRPQRVGQVQVVVRQQRGGDPGHGSPQHVQLAAAFGDARGRSFQPLPHAAHGESPIFRAHRCRSSSCSSDALPTPQQGYGIVGSAGERLGAVVR